MQQQRVSALNGVYELGHRWQRDGSRNKRPIGTVLLEHRPHCADEGS